MDILQWVMRLIYGSGCIAGVGVGLLYVLQEKIVYVPVIPGGEREYEFAPNQFQMGYKDIRVTAEDGTKLHAWQLWDRHWDEDSLKDRPTVIFFQANAGNISHRLHYFHQMILRLECVVIALSYRGYGWSEGKPTEAGIKMDSEAILNYVMESDEINSKELYIFGRSLGGAVAIHLAAKHPEKVRGLIIENTFTSLEDMVPQVLPILGALIGRGKVANFLVRNKWYNILEIKKLTNTPILMFSSEMDEMVPQKHMQELHQACKSASCNLVSLPAHHMDAYCQCPQEYWREFQKFLQSTLNSSM